MRNGRDSCRPRSSLVSSRWRTSFRSLTGIVLAFRRGVSSTVQSLNQRFGRPDTSLSVSGMLCSIKGSVRRCRSDPWRERRGTLAEERRSGPWAAPSGGGNPLGEVRTVGPSCRLCVEHSNAPVVVLTDRKPERLESPRDSKARETRRPERLWKGTGCSAWPGQPTVG